MKTMTDLQPLVELDKFCKEYDFWLELEKPFHEFDELLLKVVDREGNVVEQATVDEVLNIQTFAADMLNGLGKKF